MGGRLDVDVSDLAVFGILADGLVRGDVGVFGDDVPGVQEAGEEAKTAEGEVDEGVDGAEAGFHPDCGGEVRVWVWDGDVEWRTYLRVGGRGWRLGRGRGQRYTF